MNASPPDVVLQRYDHTAAAQVLGQLADLHDEIHAEPPYDQHPLWRRDAFLDRTQRQVRDPGFVLITARIDETVVGFAFGLPIAAGRWFHGDTEPPAELLAATKFAVIELDVRKPWRRRGIGGTLLDALLDSRPEQYAILGTLPDGPAREMYRRRGWFVAATTHPSSDYPYMETLALPLTDSAGRTQSA